MSSDQSRSNETALPGLTKHRSPFLNAASQASVPTTASTDAVALGSDTAAAALDLDGSGVKIGIISDSFDALGSAAADEASGALPSAANVHVLQDDPSGRDEGRAMAEIVHSVAPGAQIYFYASDRSSGGFAAGVAAMQAAGCSIICDDVTCPKEPFFQMGDTIEKAIDAFTDAGGTFFTCASNAGPNSALQKTWSGIAASLPGIGSVEALNMGTDAAPSAFETVHLAANASTSFDLQWAQPWASIDGTGSAYSLALAIYDPSGKLVADIAKDDVGSDAVQNTSFTPTETGNYTIAVYQNGGTAPSGPVKIIGNNNSADGVSFADASSTGSIFGHNADPQAITVGAVRASHTPANGGTLESEPFSAAGSGELLFDSTGKPLATPAVHAVPDVSGPDGQATTLPTSDLNPFLGTSAATPAVAALGALMKQADPDLDAGDIRTILKSTALPFGTLAQAGAGFAQASGALAEAEAANTTRRNTFFGTDQSGILWQGPHGAADISSVEANGTLDTTALATTPGAGWTATGTGDFSGTGGHSDILWQDADGALAVSHIVQGEQVSEDRLDATPGSNWSVVQTGDFNADGNADILFQNAQGALKLWTMDGDQVTSSTNLGSPGAGWTAKGVGDFTGDGKSDILFQNGSGALQIWTMDGATVEAEKVLTTTPGSQWTVAGIGDLNDNGRADILLRGEDGALSIWGTDGASVTSRQAVSIDPGADWIVAGIGAFTGSAGSDILLQNTTTGSAEILSPHAGGTATLSQSFAAPGAGWHALAH